MLRFPFGNMLSHDGIKARKYNFLFRGERMRNEGLYYELHGHLGTDFLP